MFPDIPACQQRPQSIKILLIRHRLPQKKLAVRTLCHPVILVQRRLHLKISFRRLINLPPPGALPVHDRRKAPFKNGCTAFVKMDQRLSDIPPIDIKNLIQLPFDHIPLRIQPQILLRSSYIDKPDIIVAVRGSKSPGPASRFHGVQDLYTFPLLNLP